MNSSRYENTRIHSQPGTKYLFHFNNCKFFTRFGLPYTDLSFKRRLNDHDYLLVSAILETTITLLTDKDVRLND